MPITRKALAVANKLLELLDDLPPKERDGVVEILIDTMNQERPDVRDIAGKVKRAQIVTAEDTIEPRVRAVGGGYHYRGEKRWKGAKPEIANNLPFPRRRDLTKAEVTNLKRNTRALMNKKGITVYDVAKIAKKKGYQVSPASALNVWKGLPTMAITQMVLHAVAAALEVSPDQLLKRHA